MHVAQIEKEKQRVADMGFICAWGTHQILDVDVREEALPARLCDCPRSHQKIIAARGESDDKLCVCGVTCLTSLVVGTMKRKTETTIPVLFPNFPNASDCKYFTPMQLQTLALATLILGLFSVQADVMPDSTPRYRRPFYGRGLTRRNHADMHAVKLKRQARVVQYK